METHLRALRAFQNLDIERIPAIDPQRLNHCLLRRKPGGQMLVRLMSGLGVRKLSWQKQFFT